MATRKISDLTLLETVSSSDTLLLLDNSDPTDQNKRTNVGSIFKAVPSGTSTNPGFQFELKTNTGVFSSSQGQIGLALGDSRLSLQKVGSSLVVAAQDTADTNLDFTLQAQGTGLIRLASPLAITDTLFNLPNTSDNTKLIRFSAAQVTSGQTNVYVMPNLDAQEGSDTVVTTQTTQTLSNKTFSSAAFTGTTSFETLTATGSATIGDNNADTLTVNAVSTFASAATFANAVQVNSTLGATGAVTFGSTLAAGNTTITGTLGATQAVNFGSTLDVNGVTTIDDATVATSGGAAALYVTGGIFSSNQYCAGIIEAVGFTGPVTGNLTGDVSGATVTTTGDVTVGGNLSVDGQATQLGIVPVTSNATKVGIGRAPTTYALEVAGDIYFTGDNIIGGDAALDGFVVQKAVAGINFDVRSSTNTVELRVDASGNLGVKKSPGSFALDVSGNSNIDGDLTIAVTDAINNVGGTLNCRDITLTDPVTNQSTTLSATTAGSGSGVSRAKMFFHAYSS